MVRFFPFEPEASFPFCQGVELWVVEVITRSGLDREPQVAGLFAN